MAEGISTRTTRAQTTETATQWYDCNLNST